MIAVMFEIQSELIPTGISVSTGLPRFLTFCCYDLGINNFNSRYLLRTPDYYYLNPKNRCGDYFEPNYHESNHHLLSRNNFKSFSQSVVNPLSAVNLRTLYLLI